MRSIRRLVLLLLLVPSGAWATSPTAPAPTPSTHTTNVTTHNITVPACAAGQVLIIASLFDGAVTTTTWPTTANVSTTSLRTATLPGGAAGALTEVRYRFANGSDAQIDVTTDVAGRSAHRVVCVTGAHASQAPEAPAYVTASTLTPDPPSVTPTWGSEDNLYLVTAATVSGTAVFSACPANFTNCTETAHTSGGVATGQFASTTSPMNPGTFTYTGTAVQAGTTTIAIRPAAVAAGAAKGGMMLRGVGP